MVKRVVITGCGIVSPLGCTLAEFWEGISKGKSGVGPVTYFDTTDYSCKIAAQVKGFQPERFIEKKDLRHLDRFVQYALVAAIEAVADSGIDLKSEDLSSIGVIVGSGIGGLGTIEAQHKVFLEKGPRRVSPFFVPMFISNMASGQISIYLGAKGPNTSVATACAAGNNSVGDAFKILQRGQAEVMIAGGTEAMITPLGLAAFCSARSVAVSFNDCPERASRPFDRDREGFVMGEGAGVVVLETLERALKRRAKIYAEILGYGLSGDAYHITAPDPEGEGAAMAMKMALADAGIPAQSVDYINAHGTSTPLNDKIETQAIKKVFGEHAYKVPISSTKSMTGHMLGAAGGAELIVCAMAIEKGLLPPTINLENRDPECDLDYVPNMAKPHDIEVAMSNSFGFGGHNATLIIKKYSS